MIFAQSGFFRHNLAACPQDVNGSANKELVRPALGYLIQFGTPKVHFFKMNLKRCREGQLDLYQAITRMKLDVGWLFWV